MIGRYRRDRPTRRRQLLSFRPLMRLPVGLVSMAETNLITIVHTSSGMCLTTKQFENWQATEAAFADYKASIGPFEADDLLEYLRIEYPGDAPFCSDDVRGLLARPNAYTWAFQEARPDGKGLKLGTAAGDSLRLAIDGFQFPDAEDHRKRFSWYVVEGSASAGDVTWGFNWQALTCSAAPLICAWLFALADWVGDGERDAVAPSPPWLIEPNLQFTAVDWVNGRAEITVELNTEFLPPDLRAGRRRSINPIVLRLHATAEDLRQAAIDFAASIALHSVATSASMPVSN